MDRGFTPEEILRYSRQLIIPEVGLQGQKKLKESSVLIVGCGGLGNPIATYLTASGIGRIGIVEYDSVELSNLHRQPLYTTKDVGQNKVELARERLQRINPEVQIDIFNELFTSDNARKIAEPYDILIDGTDNIPTRYLMNDLCVLTAKPYVYGAVYRFLGQVSVFDGSKGPCYRCLMPTPPSPESVPSCAVTGVVGHIPGIIGLLQVNEVHKIILGIGLTLIGKLLLFDALQNDFQLVEFEKRSNCPVCGVEPSISELIDYEEFCNMPIRDSDIKYDEEHSISATELQEMIDQEREFQLVDIREPVELEIIKIPEARNIPFHLLTETTKTWDKDQEIVLVCHIGFLSSIAQRILTEAGFSNVKNLKGGIHGWGKPPGDNTLIY